MFLYNFNNNNTYWSELIESGEIKVGDIVNYNAGDTADGKTYSYKTDKNLTGATSDWVKLSTYSSTDNITWKVLSVDNETGTIELMAADDLPYLLLSGQPGFENAEKILNDISEVYGHGKGATGARSITVEDIDKYSRFDQVNKTDYFEYGTKKSYTSGDFYKEIKDSNGNVIGYDKTTTSASEGAPIEMTDTNYQYIIYDFDENKEPVFEYNPYIYYSNTNATNAFVRDTENKSRVYWLASKYVINNDDYSTFGLRRVDCDQVKGNALYLSYGYNTGISSNVCPVVSLKSDIKMEKNSDGEWELKM